MSRSVIGVMSGLPTIRELVMLRGMIEHLSIDKSGLSVCCYRILRRLRSVP